MSAYRGPKIVTDNLVFYIDAKNYKSYTSGSWDIFNITGEGSASFQEGSPLWDGQGWQIRGDEAQGENYASMRRELYPDLTFTEGNFSVEIWCLYREFTTFHTTAVSVWNTGATPGTNEWIIGAHQTSKLNRFLVADASNDFQNAYSDEVAVLNTWYHLVGMREDTTLKLYVDGVLQSTPYTDPAISGSADTDTPLYIGAIRDNQIIGQSRPSVTFNGDIGLVRIYKKALSADEVKQNYNALKSRYGV